MQLSPLTSQIVGSYAKPHWLGNHDRAGSYDGSWWRPERDVVQEAKEDAVRLAIYEQERAGLQLVTDGEMQRASYDRHFLNGLSGVDFDRLQKVDDYINKSYAKRVESGNEDYIATNSLKPVISGEIKWKKPVVLEELRFLKRNSSRPVKVTVGGPLTLSLRVFDNYYKDKQALIMALADAMNQELRSLQAEGADVLQIDEPAFHSKFELAQTLGKQAIERLVKDIALPLIVHVCYGYAKVIKEKSASPTYPQVLELLSDCPISGISVEYEQPKHQPDLLKYCGKKHVVLGLLDLSNSIPETPDHIADRLTKALDVVPADRLHPASDCGMWYLPREQAYGKIRALGQATERVRAQVL